MGQTQKSVGLPVLGPPPCREPRRIGRAVIRRGEGGAPRARCHGV